MLAPFIIFFGLLMPGLAFRLSLIAAGAVTALNRARQAAGTIDGEAEPAIEAVTEEQRPA